MNIEYTRMFGCNRHDTHRMYMITPRDHMSHDLSYFSGPSTSGAEWTNRYRKKSQQNEVEVKDSQTGVGQYADTFGQRGSG